MKRYILSILFLLSVYYSYSQSNFKNGKIITIDRDTINCLILDKDKLNTPDFFKYKTGENSEVQIADVNNTLKVIIENQKIFVRHKVNIDMSDDSYGNLSLNRQPIFQEKTVFLKVLVDGSKSLFEYIINSSEKFFLKDNSNSITQLIYKRYYNEESNILVNEYFKQQLINEVNCKNNQPNYFKKLRYVKHQLINHFIEENKCEQSDYSVYHNKGEILFYVTTGLRVTNLTYSQPDITSNEIDFGQSFIPDFGIELEVPLPFHNQKFALLFEPNYHQLNTETSDFRFFLDRNYDLKLQMIELPVGLRYSPVKTKNIRAFIDLSYAFGLTITNQTKLDILEDLDSSIGFSYIAGVGLNFKERVGLRFKYYGTRNTLLDYLSMSSDYNTYSVSLRVKLFNL